MKRRERERERKKKLYILYHNGERPSPDILDLFMNETHLPFFEFVIIMMMVTRLLKNYEKKKKKQRKLVWRSRSC